jgi:putative membrane protein
MFNQPKRLHPISVMTSFFKQLKEMLFPIIAVTIFGGGGTDRGVLSFSIPLAIIVLTLVLGVINWLRFTYRIEENELRIESGVFVRKKRYIPFDRIQSLDQTEGLLHRAFGLVKLKVETAGGRASKEAEAELGAITREEANQIQSVLSASKNLYKKTEEKIISEQFLIYKITFKDLVVLALTSGGTGVILSAIFAVLLQFDEVIPYKMLYNQFEKLIANGVVFVLTLVMIGLFIAWLMAFIGTLFTYGNFTVTKTKNDLIITRGLIEKRQITVPLNRIQAIRITQNLVKEPFGFASVFVESAGGTTEKGKQAKVILLPVVKRGEIPTIFGEWLPDYHFNPRINPIPKRALSRYIWKGWLYSLPVIMISGFFFKPWGWLTLLLILPVTLIQYLDHRDTGWGIDANQLTLQYRTLTKNTVYMNKGKIQSINLNESYFQRNKQLSTIHALVKSGHGESGGRVVDIEKEHATQIYQWFSFDKKQ